MMKTTDLAWCLERGNGFPVSLVTNVDIFINAQQVAPAGRAKGGSGVTVKTAKGTE